MKTIMLIGCGKSKAKTKCAVRDMYTGSLFELRLELAKASGYEAYVLSALHGILELDRVIEPYEKTWPRVKTVSLDKAAWAVGVAMQLIDSLSDDEKPSDFAVLIHAGEPYVNPLMAVLHCLGFRALAPMHGMGIGEQLHGYRQMIDRVNRVNESWGESTLRAEVKL